MVASAASTPHMSTASDFHRYVYMDVTGVNRWWNVIYGDESKFNDPSQPTDIFVTFSSQVKVTNLIPI